MRHSIQRMENDQRRNQQRRIELHSTGKRSGENGEKKETVQDLCSPTARPTALPSILSRAIISRILAAARTANIAVTGPWTTEYGPRAAGKKKTARTQSSVTTTKEIPIRSAGMNVDVIILRTPAFPAIQTVSNRVRRE